MTLKKKTKLAVTTAKKTAKKVVKKAVKKSVKKAAAKTVKKVVKRAIKRAIKKAAVKTVKKIAKKPTQKTGGKSAPIVPVTQQASFSILEGDAGKRIDRFLGDNLENASRTRIQKWMEEGHIRVNGEPARKSRLLGMGDTVNIEMPPEETLGRVEPQDIPLEIVFEDKYLAVVNKPKGLVTHPGHGVPNGTLANALAYRFKALSDFGGIDRPGIVHRLDRDTSGLLVVARDNATHAALSQQLSERLIHRTYRAIIWREPDPEGTFDWPLGRHPKDPVKRAVIPPDPRLIAGKPAVTHYRVLDWYQFGAEVEVKLETGRTHQIRVHFSHAGFPVVGDTLYGGGESMLGRVPPLFQTPAAGLLKRLNSQALHAAKLAFKHPRTGKKVSFSAPLPEEFQAALKFLKPFKREEEEES